tara:strand:+ start:1216 stop:1722 length:507 start_codon:yes stop_codon:yes gene_type:complete
MKRLLVFSFICLLFSCDKQREIYFTLESTQPPTVFDNSIRLYTANSSCYWVSENQSAVSAYASIKFPSIEGIECAGLTHNTISTARSQTYSIEKGTNVDVTLTVNACRHSGGGVTGGATTSQFLQQNIGTYTLKAHIGRREYVIYENYQPYIDNYNYYKNEEKNWIVP